MKPRIDQLLDLASRALVVQGQMGAGLDRRREPTADLLELHSKGERLLIELQDWIIDTRMVPVSTFFRSHARTVRDAARAQRKRARLRIEGERVRVDTGIGESARDVLTHLVRNAIDHGIEPPSRRAIAAASTPKARSRCAPRRTATRSSSRSPTTAPGLNLVEDPRPGPRAIGRANVDSMGTQELHQLIFEPGFSTAEKVTELSGRGVGMDVVRRNVEDLHGTVEIESIEGSARRSSCASRSASRSSRGSGSTSRGTDYVLPLDEVVECLELTPDLRAVAEPRGLINVHGEPIAYVDLRDLLDTAGEVGLGPAGRRGSLPLAPRRARRGRDPAASDRRSSSRSAGCSDRWRAFPDRRCGADGGVAFVIDVRPAAAPVATSGGGAVGDDGDSRSCGTLKGRRDMTNRVKK